MIAVVTGAGRGIGRAVARELAARGCDVALLGRTERDLESAAREISRRTLVVRCDVTDAKEVEAAREIVESTLGVPSIVVNNAGVVVRTKLEDTSEEAWDHVVGVNLKGTFLVSRAFLPSMRKSGRGRLVAIGSISGTLGTPRLTAYCAAKWGVLGFTKALAEELRGSGLQTLCVMPGSVDTEMLAGSGFAPDMSPEDVAKVVAYAALDAPPAMNGSAVEVFGP